MAVALSGLSTMSVNGATTYNYFGPHFTTITGSAPPGIFSDFITASITFATPLGPNLSSVIETPVSWSISDQIDTITSADAPAFLIQSTFSTDGSGNIAPPTIFSVQEVAGGSEIGMEVFDPGGDAVLFSIVAGPSPGLVYQASTAQTGKFEIAPEPGTIGLGLCGGLILVTGRRRGIRFRRNTVLRACKVVGWQSSA